MTSVGRSCDQEIAGAPSVRGVFDGFITEAEYAGQRGVSLRTCQRDRALRKAPPHVVIGRTVYYRIESVREWLATQERQPGRIVRPRRRSL
jgi:hypothetical protein